MGLLETAYDATNRQQDEELLMGGLANFQLRAQIREHLYRLDPKDFWNPIYGRIWSAARELADQSRIITLAPFREHLTEKEYSIFESFQGAGVRMVEVERGIEYVREAAKRRRLLQGLKDVCSVATRTEQYDDVLGAAHKALDTADHAVLDDDVSEIAELVDRFWEEVENPPETPNVIPTPWPKLNQLLPGGGLGRSGLMVSAAHTGKGKSLFMVNTASFAALNGFKVALFSLEMSRMEVLDRILACTAEASVSAISRRKVAVDPTDPEYWSSVDFAKLDSVSDLLRSTVLHVWDEGNMTVDWIRAQCVAMKRTVGLDLVVVDYLQILDSTEGDNREQKVSNDAKRLKQLAKALDVHVLTASQMNESEKGLVPTEASLRESRGIGQHANQVVFVHHELDEQTNQPSGAADLVVAKNRGGRPGKVPVEFMGNQARFREMGK